MPKIVSSSLDFLARFAGSFPQAPRASIQACRRVMPGRYVMTFLNGAYRMTCLFLRVIIEVVPVVGLEPTRLFKGPGF
jgi:hypothetical protein